MSRSGIAVYWRNQLMNAPVRAGALDLLGDALTPLTVERLSLGALAGPRRRDEPAHRWMTYKEAFSPGLVREILDAWEGLDGPLLDPFAGSGTSILVAVERNLPGIGIERLAYPQWAANATLAARYADAERLREISDSVATLRPSGMKVDDLFLSVPAASWALSPEVTRALLTLRGALPVRGSGPEADLAHLALVTTVEAVSMAVKDGTSLRHRERCREGRTTRPGRKGLTFNAGDVVEAFGRALCDIADDLPKLPSSESTGCVIRADARDLPLADRSVGCAVFSPPYPNRYDYTAVYQLELAVGGFVNSRGELRSARGSLLRSHLESPEPEEPVLDDPVVVQVLRDVVDGAASARMDGGRTIRMLVGYFDDMKRVFTELARVMRPGAPAACVVATQTYFGTAVPTDLMLASLALRAGLTVEGLWVLRRKRVPVQQRALGDITSAGGRECVLLMRRAA